MITAYKILSVDKLAHTADRGQLVRLAADVEFYASLAAAEAGGPALCCEDFIIDVRLAETRVVRDAAGRLKLASGAWLAPAALEAGRDYEFAQETVTLDVMDQLRACIEGHLSRHPAVRGDRRDGRIQRTRADASGVLARAEVAQAVGQPRQLEGATP